MRRSRRGIKALHRPRGVAAQRKAAYPRRMAPRPTLLLLPGLLCDARLWRDQVAGLADVADCVVADLTLDSSVSAMAARALAGLPPRVAVCGLSMGGYVALEILRRAPGRVERLALFDTSARADLPEQGRRRRILMSMAKEGSFKGVTPRLLPQLVHPRHVEGPLGAEVMAMAERVGQEAFLRQQEAIMGRPDSRPDLARIRVPTLVACGAEDALTPPDLAREIAAGIPGARLELIADSGHLPTMEQPAAATVLLRTWLAA
jgi:pimeloyl-ACP methyl ester carboxylesterase